MAVGCGAVAPLHSLLRTGTPRAKRKASQLLQHMREADLLQRPQFGGITQHGANTV